MESLWERIRDNLEWFANVEVTDEIWEQIKKETTKEIFKHEAV